jgi:hypothetical protein
MEAWIYIEWRHYVEVCTVSKRNSSQNINSTVRFFHADTQNEKQNCGGNYY